MMSNVGIAVLATGGEEYIQNIFPGAWPSNAVAFVNKLKDPTIKYLYLNAIPYYYQGVNNPARLRNAALWYFRDKEYIFMVEDMVGNLDNSIFEKFVSEMIHNDLSYLAYVNKQSDITPTPGFELFKGDACRRAGALDLVLDGFWESWLNYLSRIDGLYQDWVENQLPLIPAEIEVQDAERLSYYQEQPFELVDFGGSMQYLPIKEPEGKFYL